MMNREIKFRFWLGHICKMTYEHNLSEVGRIITDFTEDIIPLQYTGLKDKSGKEIYEGDILIGTYGGTVYQMNWKGCLHGVSSLGTKLSCDIPKKIERDFIIIGNIYQNPELINR